MFASVLAPATGAQNANEYQVKAAFILNFARFVEWPGDSLSDGGTLVIGVIGDDPFGNSIDQVVSRATANGRRLAVRRLKRSDNLRACQILFIASSEHRRVGQILDKPGSNGFEYLLVGCYEGKHLIFIAKIRNGFTPGLRREAPEHFPRLTVSSS